MAATEILAIGTTAADSADVVVTTALTVALKDDTGPGLANGVRVQISLKDDDGQYFVVDELTAARRALVITGPGTYRFSRYAGASCGVFSG